MLLEEQIQRVAHELLLGGVRFGRHDSELLLGRRGGPERHRRSSIAIVPGYRGKRGGLWL